MNDYRPHDAQTILSRAINSTKADIENIDSLIQSHQADITRLQEDRVDAARLLDSLNQAAEATRKAVLADPPKPLTTLNEN